MTEIQTVQPSPTAWAMHTTSCLNDGGTFDRLGRSPVSGYAVTVKVLDTMPFLSAQAIEGHLRAIPAGNYLGTWLDHENRRWEISETAVFKDRDDALMLARELGERYVYDLDNDVEIAA